MSDNDATQLALVLEENASLALRICELEADLVAERNKCDPPAMACLGVTYELMEALRWTGKARGEAIARALSFAEKGMWPNGVACPHCDHVATSSITVHAHVMQAHR